ncbi:MAG TPA: hypothetical protein VE990_08820 [Acidimicrobiales bacterium]|nr:hypothetical protein [Acidimicrobiales bacterium]
MSGPALHQFLLQSCPGIAQAPILPGAPGPVTRGPADPAVFNACIDRLASVYHQTVAYIAPARYSTMQWLETALFLGAALALVGVAVWLVKRTPS